MRNWLQNFMYGRYGSDPLNRCISFVALILIIINFFVKTPVLWYIALVLLILMYFRMFSRNTSKRYAENEKFMSIMSRITKGRFPGGGYGGYGRGGYDGFQGYGGYGGYQGYGRQQSADQWRAQREQQKYYKFFLCPQCSQKVRVPRGKGKIEITCPKCRTSFIKRT